MPDASGSSAAYDLLHEQVRRWIWLKEWNALRDIQEEAIPILLSGERDLIISAATASGKTEAAFLPIVSAIATRGLPRGAGFEAMYVGPLRALINDQFRRIEALCGDAHIPIVKWHGDVSNSMKRQARKQPGGILLITPESLEAILCRRGQEAPRLFAALRYVVIDELHAFLGSERGRHLQSLMHRAEEAAQHFVARIGLSATLADMGSARAFLRPRSPDAVEVIESATRPDICLAVHGFEQPPRAPAPRERGDPAEEEQNDPTLLAIARHMFDKLSTKRGLIFADRRDQVERLTAELRTLCETRGVDELFFAHHGKLSRELREDAEDRLRDGSKRGSIVATSTLELGIDVGDIEEVAQLGAGHSVAGLRQRLGRSGRREGSASRMRLYVEEPTITEQTGAHGILRAETVKCLAMVHLMARKWNEPPIAGRLHLSALVHQIMALVLQHGPITSQQGWEMLCESDVFAETDHQLFLAILERMRDEKVRLIELAPDGTLLLGEEGERATASFDFYPVFATTIDYGVVTQRGKRLGLLAPTCSLAVGTIIILAGRYWRITEVDTKRHEVVVCHAYDGRLAYTSGNSISPDEGVVSEMRRVWLSPDVPSFLDARARIFLTEARGSFRRLGLDRSGACVHNGDVLLFPWLGNRALTALELALRRCGIEAQMEGIMIAIPAKDSNLLNSALGRLASEEPPDPVKLAELAFDRQFAKYHGYLDSTLLNVSYASERLDPAPIPAIAADLRRSVSEL